MESERYERVMAAMRREVPDRVPWTLWGHFPAVSFLKYYSWEKGNRDGEESARAHMALLRVLDYKMDLLKVTPFIGIWLVSGVPSSVSWTMKRTLQQLRFR